MSRLVEVAARRGGRRSRPGTRLALRRLELQVTRGSQTAIDALWDAWLDDPDDALWKLLQQAGRPASPDRPAHHTSLVALDHETLRITVLEHRCALRAAAERTDHPLGAMARRKLDALWRQWLSTPDATSWAVLKWWGRPGRHEPLRAVTLVALGQGDELRDRAVRAALLEAAGRDDHPIGDIARRRLDAAWARWLAEPDDRLADLLREWGHPATSPRRARVASIAALGPPALCLSDPAHRRRLIGLAQRTDHPIGDIARARILAAHDRGLVEELCAHALSWEADVLVKLCVDHQLAPADPVRRADFLLLTGQQDRYQAADPDGSLLAIAYQAADEEHRQRLRDAMVRTGNLDVMRVVVDAVTPNRVARLSAGETQFLTTQLAERRAWSQLWTLLQELPLVDAAETVRLFEEGWQPPGEDGRRLCARLRDADADLLARLAGRHDEPADVRTPDRYLARAARQAAAVPGELLAAALSPDRRELAAVIRPSPSREPVDIRILDTIAGEWVEAHESIGEAWSPDDQRRGRRLLHLGDAVVMSRRQRGDGTWPYSEVLVRCAAGRTEVLGRVKGCFTDLAPTSDGFVAVDADAAFVHPAVREARHLWFFSADGELVHKVPLGDLGVRPGFGSRAELVATDPVTGRLALGGPDGLTVLEPLAERIVDRWSSVDAKLSASGWSPAVGHHGVWFAGPDWLVTADGDGTLRSWWLQDGRLHPDVHPRPHPRWSCRGFQRRYEVGFVPDGARVRRTHLHPHQLTWVDGPHGMAGVQGLGLWAPPGGDVYVLGSGTRIDVVSTPAVAAAGRVETLVGRPLAEASPADDIDVVRTALRAPLLPGEVRSCLELLLAWLEHRFAAEVMLGRVASPAATDPYGISLAPAQGHGR